MSFDHFLWSSTGSADRPRIFTLRRSNSAFIFAMVPSSVVHTGVKSFGCEKSTAQLEPIQSWKSMWPSVVSAWKLGAVSPMRSVMGFSFGVNRCGAAILILGRDEIVNHALGQVMRPVEYVYAQAAISGELGLELGRARRTHLLV